jgi:hypothetical protein
MLLIGLFRLWLGASDEIEARHQPHDGLRYAEMADHLIAGRWLGPYDEMTLIREPGFPLWIRFVHATGMPLKLATDVFFILAALALSIALARAGLSRWAALIVFAGILFQPGSFYWNAQLAAETLYAPILLLSLAGFIAGASSRVPHRGCLIAGACPSWDQHSSPASRVRFSGSFARNGL